MSLTTAKPAGVFIVLGDQDLPMATAITDASYGTESLLQIGLPTMGTAATCAELLSEWPVRGNRNRR